MKAIGTPGELRGLYLAWSRHGSGRIPWNKVVLPAAQLARRWTISPTLARFIRSALSKPLGSSDSDPSIYRDTLLQSLFRRDDGSLKETGDVVEQPDLSNTLTRIAEEGVGYYYDTLASTLAAEIHEMGGILTARDIKNYTPNILQPIQTPFMGHQYIGVGGSSSGG